MPPPSLTNIAEQGFRCCIISNLWYFDNDKSQVEKPNDRSTIVQNIRNKITVEPVLIGFKMSKLSS